MDTLLDALQEGRLFELPENDKIHSLQFLSHIIEAFPEVPADTDVVGHVLKREEMANTALGMGWACPHARVPFDEDLKCVIGWSPAGIDYGAPDGLPIMLVVMFLVPDNQRNHYLREISILAKALQNYVGSGKLQAAKDLNEIRNFLLDLIETTKETAGPDTRARMIRLQAKPTPEEADGLDISNLLVESVNVIVTPGMRPIILTQNPALMEWLDSATDLVQQLQVDGIYKNGGWRILRRGAVSYQGGRMAYDCLAVKVLLSLPGAPL